MVSYSYSSCVYNTSLHVVCCPSLPPSPTGKKFRSKPQLARYLGNSMDLSTFDFRTGKMLISKLNKNRQRLRYDNNNQTKVRTDKGPFILHNVLFASIFPKILVQ